MDPIGSNGPFSIGGERLNSPPGPVDRAGLQGPFRNGPFNTPYERPAPSPAVSAHRDFDREPNAVKPSTEPMLKVLAALYGLSAVATAVLTYFAITSVGIRVDPISEFLGLARAVVILAAVGAVLWLTWMTLSIVRKRRLHSLSCAVTGVGALIVVGLSAHFAIADLSNNLVAQAGALQSVAAGMAESELPTILKEWFERFMESIR